SYGEELAQAIETLTTAGKPVVCHLEIATAASLLACASATKTLLAPSGLARLRTPRLTSDPEALLAHAEAEAAMVRAPRPEAPAAEAETPAAEAEAPAAEAEAPVVTADAWLAARLTRGLTRAELSPALLDADALAPEEARAAALVDGISAGGEASLALEEVLDSRVRLRRRVSR